MPADSPDARGDPPGKRVTIPRNEKPTGKPGDSSDTRGVRPLKPCHRPKEMKNRQLSLPIHLIRGGSVSPAGSVRARSNSPPDCFLYASVRFPKAKLSSAGNEKSAVKPADSSDPWGNRTPVYAVRGRRLSRLTNRPFRERCYYNISVPGLQEVFEKNFRFLRFLRF